MNNSLKENIKNLANNIIEVDLLFQLYIIIKNSNNKKINKYSYFFCVILSTIQYTFFMKLSKIILLSEEKNIYKLIDRVRCESKILGIEPILNNFETELFKEKDIINKIKKLRDKYFAHADKTYFYNPDDIFYEVNIKGESLEKIINILYKNINKICELTNITANSYEKENIVEDFNNILEKL